MPYDLSNPSMNISAKKKKIKEIQDSPQTEQQEDLKFKPMWKIIFGSDACLPEE